MRSWAHAQETQAHVEFSVLRRIDLQQCIDCQFSDAIDPLAPGASLMKIHRREATYNHC